VEYLKRIVTPVQQVRFTMLCPYEKSLNSIAACSVIPYLFFINGDCLQFGVVGNDDSLRALKIDDFA
jgi:hypothetical protein